MRASRYIRWDKTGNCKYLTNQQAGHPSRRYTEKKNTKNKDGKKIMTDKTKKIIIRLLDNYNVDVYGENNIFSEWITTTTTDYIALSDAKDALDNIIEKLLEKHSRYDEIWMDSNIFFDYIENEDNETVLLNAFYGGGCNGADVTGKFNPNDSYFLIDVYGHYYSCGWRDYSTAASDLSRYISDSDLDDTEVADAIMELLDVLDIDDTE